MMVQDKICVDVCEEFYYRDEALGKCVRVCADGKWADRGG